MLEKIIHPRYSNNVDSVVFRLHRISNHAHLIGQSMPIPVKKYYRMKNTMAAWEISIFKSKYYSFLEEFKS